MAIINFLFVYLFSGLVLALLFRTVFKHKVHLGVPYLLGFGTAPLLISLIQFYLYWLFPHRAWFFYIIITYSIWFGLLGIIYLKRQAHHKLLIPRYHIILESYKTLTLSTKLLGAFLFFIVIFVFIRGQLYPNIWDDAILYFQQGHVYSVDRSLDRLETLIPFQEDGSGYVMNPVIRPAIPLLYSFFYTTEQQNSIFIFSGSFLYFYYFILTLILFVFILRKLEYDVERILIGLILLTTCYYFINFLIYGFKEIILMFLVLFSLLACAEAVILPRKILLHWGVILAILLGFIITINYSGLIIAAIVGFVYLILLIAHRVKFWSLLINIFMVIGLIIAISVFEINNDVGFIFGHKIFNTTTQLSQAALGELSGYKIITPASTPIHTPAINQDHDTGLDIENTGASSINSKAEQATSLVENLLIKGKLQGFTQPQFYGVIFWLFGAVIILQCIQKKKCNTLGKAILGFLVMFFLIIVDPFFLNHHPQAYVLSISPKYTILLIPLIALYITMQYDVIINIFTKFNLKYLFFSSFLVLLLVPVVRHYVVAATLNIFETITPLYNTPEYYADKFNALFLLLGIAAIFLNAILTYHVVKGIKLQNKISFLNSAFLSIAFILPGLFLLNNNYAIASTLTSINAPTAQKIKTILSSNPDTVSMFSAIQYFNESTGSSDKVLFIYYRNLVYYLNNYHRFVFNTIDPTVDQSAKHIVNVQGADYIFISKEQLVLADFDQPTTVVKEFGNLLILQVQY